MFLRKLFSAKNKGLWVLVDLVIVIIGVYSAFLIQQFSESTKNSNERERIVSALKMELEVFRYRMKETSLGMNLKMRELNRAEAEGTYVDFSDYRFIEPQYDYQTIQYTLNLQNSGLIEFDLYNSLQSMLVETKKLEHVERLLTETSRNYKTIPKDLKKTSDFYKVTDAGNRDNFKRFKVLIYDRGQISGRISSASERTLVLVNEILGLEKSRQIERQLILENVKFLGSEVEAVKVIQNLYPHYSEEEIKEMYQTSKNN